MSKQRKPEQFTTVKKYFTKHPKAKPLITIVIFGGIASLLLLSIKAASFSISVEPEGANKSGVAVEDDLNASAGKYVKFGAKTSSIPAQCASGGSYLWANLELCGWPGPANTGVDMSKCPGGLTNMGSSTTSITTISQANTVISCKNITGGLNIKAQNVTIQNSKIRYNDGGGLSSSGSGVIKIYENSSATIDHVEIDGMNGTHACVFDVGKKGTSLPYSMVVKNINCHNANDGVFTWWDSSQHPDASSDFIIQDSYLHDFTAQAANGHMDGFQTMGVHNGTITHNTFKTTRTPGDKNNPDEGKNGASSAIDAALAIWNPANNVKNLTVSNNLIAGGGFAIYVYDRVPSVGGPGEGVGGYSTTDVHIINNSFSTQYGERSCVGKYGIWFYRSSWTPYFGGPTDGWNKGGSSRTGNKVLETGFSPDNGNPPGCV